MTGQPSIGIGATFGVAAQAFVPIGAVLWSLFQPSDLVLSDWWATVLPPYVMTTASLMVMVGGLSLGIGVSTAWIVTAMDFPGRRLFSFLLVLPLAAPAYIVAYLYTDLLEFAGPLQSWLRSAFGLGREDYWAPNIRSLPGAAIIISLVLYPYIYLLARASFAAQSRSQFHAARTLGLSPGRAFFRVVLPAARPAIIGGLALVLMETLADYGVADYFAIPTLSVGIFRTWLGMGDRIAAMNIASVMLLFVFLLLAVEMMSRRGRVVSDDRFSSAPPPLKLSPLGSLTAIICCLVPVVFGFIIPIGTLTVYAISVGDGLGAGALAGFAVNSFQLALLVATLGVALALLLGYAQRKVTGGPFSRALVTGGVRIATLGYALPGALLAVGLLQPLGGVDRALTAFARDNFGYSQGLLLTGTVALLIYALTIRFLTVSFNSVSGGLAKISPSMDAAARSLGAGPWRLLRRVHMPLLMPSIAAGAALVFIDVMRELPATLILRPFNFETLATRVYWLASDERLAEASTAALIVVLLGLLPVLFLTRLSKA